MTDIDALLAEVRACRACEDMLPLGPRPVFQLSPTARILVASQAPGTKVHASGIPFSDPSGDRLREWMGISKLRFYDAENIAILRWGFAIRDERRAAMRRRGPNAHLFGEIA